MMVSIVIPVFKAAPYIRKCLESIKNQTFKDLEVILVDDCGPDESAEIIDSWIKLYNGPIYFKIVEHKKNKGAAAARNTGLNVASGDFILFVDSDDYLESSCVERLINPFAIFPELNVVMGDFAGEGLSGNYRFLKKNTGLYSTELVRLYVEKEIYHAPWNKLIRKNFLLDNNIYFSEGHYFEDILWNFQVLNASKNIYILKEVTYHYLEQGSSVSHQSLARDFLQWKIVIPEITIWAFENGYASFPWMFRFIQLKTMVALKAALCSRKDFVDFHNDLKKLPHWSFIETLKLKAGVKWSFIVLFRNLPACVAYILLKIMTCLLNTFKR